MKKLITLLLLLSTSGAFSQTLIPDTLFGNGSLNSVLISQETNNYHVTNVLRANDDKILVCGWNYDISCNCHYNDMVRFTPCGDVDSSFGINGLVHHTFDSRNKGWDYALQPDGKILCTGLQADGNAGSQQFPFVARYNSNGTPDSTFGTFGSNKISYIGTTEFYNLFLFANGKILCNQGGIAMRFLPNGTVDSTFATNGLMSLPIPSGINFYYFGSSVLRTDGKLITANPAYNGNNVFSLVQAYDTLGNIDNTFGTNGSFIDYTYPVVQNAGGFTLLQSDNKVLVGYNIAPYGDGLRVYRLTTSGVMDTTFGTNGFIDMTNAFLTDLIPLSNDKFILEHGSQDFDVYDSNGIPDPGFNLGGLSNNFGSYGQIGAALNSTNGEVTFGGWDFDKSFVVSRLITAPYVPTLSQNGNALHPNVPNVSCTYQWFKDGNVLSNETDSTYTPTVSGLYSVAVTNIWGCENSNEINVIVNGINAVEINSVSVFPVPTKNSVTVQFQKPIVAATILIYDVVGKEVFQKQVSNVSSIQINLSAFSKGVYNLQLISANGKSNHKVIVQ